MSAATGNYVSAHKYERAAQWDAARCEIHSPNEDESERNHQGQHSVRCAHLSALHITGSVPGQLGSFIPVGCHDAHD